MAPLHSYLSRFFTDFPLLFTYYSEPDLPGLLLCSFIAFLILSALAISLHLYQRLRKVKLLCQQELLSQAIASQRVEIGKSVADCGGGTGRTRLTCSLIFEISTPDSPKWGSCFAEKGRDLKGVELNEECGDSGQEEGGKRKKKRVKKKRASENENENENEQELPLVYPFTSPTSVIQKEIKQQYDELMKCQESKELPLAQVKQFDDFLQSTKIKLQSRADTIHRKLSITKFLLSKAHRSSFDRFQQQIYKLELEQKRLEEDNFAYSCFQQRLTLTPEYKKMLEIDSSMELMEKPEKPTEKIDSGVTDTSFEELLEREKKDSFWQRYGKVRSCSS